MSQRRPLQISDLNEHCLWALLSTFEAVDLLNFGLTCKRFHGTTESKTLWFKVAKELQEDGCGLPLLWEDVLENLSLKRLRQVAIRACNVQRNISQCSAMLTRNIVLKPSWKLFARQAIPEEGVDCIKIFNRKWIVYRRPDCICVRHISAVKIKAFHEIPMIGFVGWPFELAQVNENTAMIGIRHDVNEEWLLLEVIFGASPKDKPKIRPLPLDRAKHLSLFGRSYAVVRSRGVERFVDVYTGQGATIDSHPVGEKSHLLLDEYLFTAYSRPGGRIHILASRLGKGSQPIISSSKSKTLIRLKDACIAFPPDHRMAHTILRPSSNKSQLSIWHWIPAEHKGEYVYALFIIEQSFFIPNAFEGDESVEWGAWSFRSCYTPQGNFFVGMDGQSSVVTRHRARRAYLTVYPRLHIPINDGFSTLKSCGIELPLPDVSCTGDNVRSVRVAWDDASGVAVLLFPSGMLWVLHYG